MTKVYELTAPLCPWHGIPAQLVDARDVYGRADRPDDRVWVCPESDCDARVGAHPDGRPLGTLANARLRKARRDAHAAFDLWRTRVGISRGAAYRQLAAFMGVEVAHMGEMNSEECGRVSQEFGRRLQQGGAR